MMKPMGGSRGMKLGIATITVAEELTPEGDGEVPCLGAVDGRFDIMERREDLTRAVVLRPTVFPSVFCSKHVV